MLDIGGDIGALVLHTPPELNGTEIEISRVGEPRTGKHVAVHPRRLGSGVVHAAVYGDLTAGHWQLWSPEGRRGPLVTIVGGQIAEAWWPQDG